MWRGTLIIVISWLVTAAADDAGPLPKSVRPTPEYFNIVEDLTYGELASFPLPKTILFSASPDEIIADAEEWARRGITAFFMDYVAREWSSDIWAADGKPWTIGRSDEFFQKARLANEICKKIGAETFLKIAFDNYFDWFDDIAWQRIINNFRQFAIFARETGCTGIALDIEYCGKQYSFDWEGYDYQGYSRKDLIKKVQERMTDVIAALYEEFPEMVFLTFPEHTFSLGLVIQSAWIEEAARRRAPGGFHYCTEGTYRRPNINYMFAHGAMMEELFHRVLSKRAWAYWKTHGTIAAGVWPFGFDYQTVLDPGLTLEQFRQAYAASLMMSKRYNWIYSHNARELLIGRALSQYKGEADIPAYLEIIRDRKIVTSPKYVEVANKLRAHELIQYSDILGVGCRPHIMGPLDNFRLELVPSPVLIQDKEIITLLWQYAIRYYRGEVDVLLEKLQPITEWLVCGPFPSDADWSGHTTIYPPETDLTTTQKYQTPWGEVGWKFHRRKAPYLSVDLKEAMAPSEFVTAYALCYVNATKPVKGQVRLGTNDMAKAWLGDTLIYDYPYEGNAYLDRDIIDVEFPAGKTRFLLKVTNGIGNWAFICRFTDANGSPLKEITTSIEE